MRYSTLNNASRLDLLAARGGLLLIFCALISMMPGARAANRPNIIFLLSDDVGQGDLGCYGQKLIQTPNLDRMAAEGTRYTQAYCGSSICAPSRTSLMTGWHAGHAPVRGNYEIKAVSAFGSGQLPLPASTVTVAQILKSAGYATACTGKWGMGQFDTTGSPLKKGFDHFFGYNGQVQAHEYFPPELYQNDQRIELPENKGGAKKTYAPDLILKDTLDWIRTHKDGPFFLFDATTLPHGNFEINDLGEYANREGWTQTQKTYAAMVTRLDRDVGALFALLKELKIDTNTLVIFAGDNGSSFAPDTPVGKLFDQNMGGKLRGYKSTMYEGGLRQAAIARWPGIVPAGRVSDDPWAFWDFLPTAAELADAKIPASCQPDGLSLVSFLKGEPAPKRKYFYWELHAGQPLRVMQAIRFGDWKAVKNGPNAPVELYNLREDSGEKNNVAASHSDLVDKAGNLMRQAHVDNPNWPMHHPPKLKQP